MPPGASTAGPASVVQTVLAATAGTVFEAAPFVFIAAALRSRSAICPRELLRVARHVLPFVGCGCTTRAGVGALSLPATALCWISFGPAVAVARVALGAAILIGTTLLKNRSAGAARTATAIGELPSADPLAELVAIAVTTAAFTFARATVLGHLAANVGLAASIGLVLGAMAPCATAGVAVAAAAVRDSPWLAAAMLLTTGIVPARIWRLPSAARCDHAAANRGRFTATLLAIGCGLVAARNGEGFVNPRFVPLIAVAGMLAAVAAAHGISTRQPRSATMLAAALLLALVLGSPVPEYRDDESTLASAYVGESLTFTGRLAADRKTLVRFEITCCRADARAIALRLARAIPRSAGSWIIASGRIRAAPASDPELDSLTWRVVPPPADPFIYL